MNDAVLSDHYFQEKNWTEAERPGCRTRTKKGVSRPWDSYKLITITEALSRGNNAIRS